MENLDRRKNKSERFAPEHRKTRFPTENTPENVLSSNSFSKLPYREGELADTFITFAAGETNEECLEKVLMLPSPNPTAKSSLLQL